MDKSPTDSENFTNKTKVSTSVTFSMVKYRAKEFTFSQMALIMKEISIIIKRNLSMVDIIQKSLTIEEDSHRTISMDRELKKARTIPTKGNSSKV